MVSRLTAMLVAFILTSALAPAQVRGGAGGGRPGAMAGGPSHGGARSGAGVGITGGSIRISTGGFGVGFPRPGVGLAPFTGFGNVNHPGLGFAPNTPGIGFPVGPAIQPLPTLVQPLPTAPQPFIGPIRPGATVIGPWAGFGYRRYPFRGGVIAIPVPVYVGGYGYDYGYGYGGIVNGVTGVGTQTPTVIVIQQPSELGTGQEGQIEQPGTWAGPSRFLYERSEKEEQARPLIYESRPPSSDEKPVKPLTLLVLKNHTIYAVTDYWKEGDRLYYVTSYGAQGSVSIEEVDLEMTRRLNAERNVKFEL